MKKKLKKVTSKIFTSLIILLTIFTLSGLFNLSTPQEAQAADWFTETLDSEGDVGSSSSLALDSNNNPHIIYRDSTNYDLKYAYKSSGTWHIETVPNVSPSGLNLILDSSNNPHIIYSLGINEGFQHSYKSDGTWHKETVISDGTYKGFSFAFDSSNKLHISYFDGTNDDLNIATNQAILGIIKR